jgi:hypothetical protein
MLTSTVLEQSNIINVANFWDIATWRYVPEGGNIRKYRCESLQSYKITLCLLYAVVQMIETLYCKPEGRRL